jgi:hypothetical protein
MKRGQTLVVIALVLTISGCGGADRLQTRGRILKDGQPFRPDEGDVVRVMFVPIPADGGRATDFHMAEFNATDGTFRAAGKDLKGIPPGKYRVTVEHLRKKKDLLKGAFDAENSPIIREINSTAEEVTIDLARPKG